MQMPCGVPSAHVDQYARTLLPPPSAWPVFDYSGIQLGPAPTHVNAAEVLLSKEIANRLGDKPCYHYDGTTWSYRQLFDYTDRIARVLVEDYGLVPGNRVLLRSGNNPMLVACFLAVLKAGGICVTTMPLLRKKELTYIINRVAIRFALCDEPLAEELESASEECESLERIAYFTSVGSGKTSGADLDRAVANKSPGFKCVQTAADDIAVMTFTSGTTGHPKAAAHFHWDLLATCECFPRTFTVSPDDVIGGSPSVAFTYGMAAFILFPLRFHATVALVPRPTPEYILDSIQRYKVTSLYCVPTSYNQMLGEVDRFDISSLVKCASAGENLQMNLWKRWHDRTGLRLVNGIGATELLSHFMSESMAVDRIGSTGKAVPGYTVILIDQDGQPLPTNARGRIAVRGPTGTRYLDDLERQHAHVQNGWNVTGDVFVLDEEGYFWFVDRADDMIVSAGYNISPQEVERALLEHPMVNECAVVGVDDANRGKLTRACVVLAASAAATPNTVHDIQEFVKHRIAPYKYPRQVLFYDSLPRTHTGKIQRHVLRDDKALAEHGIQSGNN